MTSSKAVQIVVKQENASLSKDQKTFNRLIKKIQQDKETLLLWRSTLELYNDDYLTKYKPIKENYDQKREKLVFLLDNGVENFKFTQTEVSKLHFAIKSIVYELMNANETEELKLIYNKYFEEDYDEASEEAMEAMKESLKEMFDIELDDVDLDSSEDDIFSSLGQKLYEKAQQEEEERATKKATKKSPKMVEAEKKEAQINLSIQEIFRKLVKDLHPDRERDPTERARKNELMQRVNKAYDKKDLLGLLELQLEIEQISADSLNAIAEDRLKHYNQVLKGQTKQLEDEIEMFKEMLMFKYNIPIYFVNDPDEPLRFLKHETEEVKEKLEIIDVDLVSFQEVKGIKVWLKNVTLPKKGRKSPFFEPF